jgi:penicillin-binding protein 1A
LEIWDIGIDTIFIIMTLSLIIVIRLNHFSVRRDLMPNSSNNSTRNSGNKTYKKNTKKGSSTLKIIFLSFLAFILLAVAGVVVTGTIFVIRISEGLPSISQLTTKRTNVPSVIYDRNNEVIAKLFTENRNPVELKNISPWMVKAVLAAEDSDFYSHNGISVWGIARALWFDIQHKLFGTGSLQGGSTITQQLARSLYLPQERILTRKIKEMLISFKLESIFSKDKILEMYLNTIYFGRGAWGIDTAAYTYFGKSASELNEAESAILAGLIPAPNRYNPETNITRAKSRQSYVLERMKILGWLTESQVYNAKMEELVFKHTPNKVEEYNRAPYFVSHILLCKFQRYCVSIVSSDLGVHKFTL